ncbi:MAG: Type 1 glutamine amidotransferase-like domain-containing protein [Patescibacteria group bacterium]
MVKLLLTSAGLTHRDIVARMRELLIGLDNKKVGVLYTVRNPGDECWLKQQEQEMRELGIDYEMVNISIERNIANELSDFGVYYVTGGNTFYILDQLRRTGIDKLLLDRISSGCVYVGLSAGSIIAGPDIEVAGFGIGADENDINLTDLSGLGWVDVYVWPHYLLSDGEDLRRFYQQKQKMVVGLTDEQAILVDGEQMRVIGAAGGIIL